MKKTSKLSVPVLALGLAVGTPGFAAQAETVTVESGDTFWSISQEHGVSVEQLTNLNSDINPNAIPIGTELLISEENNNGSEEEEDSREVYHTVAPYNTLYDLAQLHAGVTLQDLYDWNPGIDPYNLQVGSEIRVQPPEDNSDEDNDSSREVYHTVAPGDTLYGLAQLHAGVTLQDLYDWNPGIDPLNLQVGDEIRVSD